MSTVPQYKFCSPPLPLPPFLLPPFLTPPACTHRMVWSMPQRVAQLHPPVLVAILEVALTTTTVNTTTSAIQGVSHEAKGNL